MIHTVGIIVRPTFYSLPFTKHQKSGWTGRDRCTPNCIIDRGPCILYIWRAHWPLTLTGYRRWPYGYCTMYVCSDSHKFVLRSKRNHRNREYGIKRSYDVACWKVACLIQCSSAVHSDVGCAYGTGPDRTKEILKGSCVRFWRFRIFIFLAHVSQNEQHSQHTNEQKMWWQTYTLYFSVMKRWSICVGR